MDITTIYKVIICIGILKTCSLYQVGAVDGILFQAPEVVEWSQADQICQNNNGKLFKPNETLFDASLFSKCNVKDDLWVAATYIKLTTFVSAFKDDSFTRCEMCQIEESCGITCLYKACGDQCNVVCLGVYVPHNRILSDRPKNWTEAKQWCSEHVSEFGDKIQSASFLFSIRYCDAACFWTRKVIKVKLKTVIDHGNEPGECGILHNGTISFTSCTRYLHPLCERDKSFQISGNVTKTALETPRHYFSDGNHSCILMNNKITPMTTTQGTNRLHAAITTSSKYETLSVANDIEKRTTIGLNEENPSLLVPVGVTPSKNDLEDSPKNSDTGIIIGAVIGSIVFLMLTVLGIICVRRKLLQRTIRSKRESKNMNMLKTDTTHKPINHYQRQDVPLDSESGPFAQLESKCEGSRSDIVGQNSYPGKSAFTIDPEGSNFNYAIVAKKVNVNSSNLINDDSYDHLHDIRQNRYDNVTGNVYDTTNFNRRNDSTYDISDGHSKTPDEGVGLYDRVNTTISSEYDTTDDLRRDSNADYDHI